MAEDISADVIGQYIEDTEQSVRNLSPRRVTRGTLVAFHLADGGLVHDESDREGALSSK